MKTAYTIALAIILITVIVFLVVSNTPLAKTAKSIDVDFEDTLCSADIDCVIVRTQCGTCASASVNAEHMQKYDLLYLDVCSDAMESPSICASLAAVCENGECVLK